MVSRRDAVSGLLAAPGVGLAAGSASGGARRPSGSAPLGPADFAITGTYLNAAYTHPMPLAAAAAAARFIAGRADPGRAPDLARDAKALFARLINADPSDIARIPSTSYGESFLVGALGLQGEAGAGVVTDILHFDGALYMYGELARQGASVTVLPMTPDGRIDMNALDSAVTARTRLVAVSLVSMVNGFEHDLKTVCDIAHRRGALVYVDAVQAAGATPIDVKASGVDVLACSSFKWLMGDFGCGYLYVRPDVRPRLRRTQFGYHQPRSQAYHFLPGDPPGGSMFEAEPDDATAAGLFEVGSLSITAEVANSVSIRRILDTGVEAIEARRRPWMARLRDRLGGRYRCLTPEGTASAIIAFSLIGADKALGPRIREARINIQLYDNRFRISPSVYNAAADIDRVIDVLLG